MKTIGLIGGMSWESTAEYHRLLNERGRERLGRPPLRQVRAVCGLPFSHQPR